MVMESIFSRLLSLLAYHPDYPPADLDEATKLADLTDFARYILFYLSAVANERNLSLIFHVAQRVKQTRDGITKSDEISTRLHTLSTWPKQPSADSPISTPTSTNSAAAAAALTSSRPTRARWACPALSSHQWAATRKPRKSRRRSSSLRKSTISSIVSCGPP